MLILPFTPVGRQNMVSWMAANSDPESYGETVVYTFPSGRNIDGPTQVFAQINQDPVFSAQRTLLGSGGSTIVFGDFLVIPINDSLLYVQPVYVRSAQESAIPELKRVLVVNGDRVGLGTSLAEALADSTTGQVDERRTARPRPKRHHRRADHRPVGAGAATFRRPPTRRLTAGDLGTYQSELAQAQALVQAGERSGGRAGEAPAGPTSADAVDHRPARHRSLPALRVEPEPQVGIDVGDVHLRLLQTARSSPSSSPASA